MSDTQQSVPTSRSAVREERASESFREPSGWAGMVLFAGIMLIMLGIFQAITGLVAIFDNGYYLVGQNGLVVNVDYTAWGWTHLFVGVLAFAAGFGLFTGAMWSRVVGIVIAVLSAVMNFAFIPAYPFWSIMIITLDVLIIYAIATHGRELKPYSDVP